MVIGDLFESYSACSSKQPGVGQAKDRSTQLHPGLSRAQVFGPSSDAFSSILAGNLIRSRAAGA